MKKPKWVVEKERLRKSEKEESFFLFGLHAVEDALFNPRRKKLRLIVTKNARAKLAKAIEVSGITPEVLEPRDLNDFIDRIPFTKAHCLRLDLWNGAVLWMSYCNPSLNYQILYYWTV